MNGSLPVLPTVLPQGLFDAAARGPLNRPVTGDVRQRPPPPGPPRQLTGQIPAVPPIPKQFSGGVNPPRTQSPLRRHITPPPGPPPPLAPQSVADIPWVITPQDKVKFDSHFAELDTGNKGYITGIFALHYVP